jgi:hypothetical protein
MKDAGLVALKVGLAGAAVLLMLFAVMSFLIDRGLDDYYNKPHDWISDDVGFFWQLAYFGLSLVVILANGPASVLAAIDRIKTGPEALAVPAVACGMVVIMSTIAITIYETALSAGNLLPYFRVHYTYQVAPMFQQCLPAMIVCGAFSVICGYLISRPGKRVFGGMPPIDRE